MDNLPQEFDDFCFSYTPQHSGATYGSMPSQEQAPFKESIDGEYDHLSHHSYGYTHALWSPWEMHPSQAHAMIPTSQMRSSAEHESIMIQFPLPYPPQIAQATPITSGSMTYFPSLSGGSADTADDNNNLSNFWDSSSSPHIYASPSLSSDSTSSPSPPTPSPPAQQPLVIHQPRPYRRIPIVSLSQLASACDSEAVESKPPQSINALSPLPFEYLDFNINSSANGAHQLMSQHSFPFLASSHPYKVPGDKTLDRTVLCTCGCMEHYIRS